MFPRPHPPKRDFNSLDTCQWIKTPYASDNDILEQIDKKIKSLFLYFELLILTWLIDLGHSRDDCFFFLGIYNGHRPKDTTLRNAKNVSKNISFITLAQNARRRISALGLFWTNLDVALDTCLLQKPTADILLARPTRVWHKSVYILSHKIFLTIVPC